MYGPTQDSQLSNSRVKTAMIMLWPKKAERWFERGLKGAVFVKLVKTFTEQRRRLQTQNISHPTQDDQDDRKTFSNADYYQQQLMTSFSTPAQ